MFNQDGIATTFFVVDFLQLGMHDSWKVWTMCCNLHTCILRYNTPTHTCCSECERYKEKEREREGATNADNNQACRAGLRNLSCPIAHCPPGWSIPEVGSRSAESESGSRRAREPKDLEYAIYNIHPKNYAALRPWNVENPCSGRAPWRVNWHALKGSHVHSSS